MSQPKKATTIRADEEMLKEAQEIAASVGLGGFTATVRYCLKQVHTQLQKEAS